MPGLPIPGYPLLRMGLPAGASLRRAWSADRPDLVHVATEGPLGLSAIKADVLKQTNDATDAAENLPYPSVDDMTRNVYAGAAYEPWLE